MVHKLWLILPSPEKGKTGLILSGKYYYGKLHVRVIPSSLPARAAVLEWLLGSVSAGLCHCSQPSAEPSWRLSCPVYDKSGLQPTQLASSASSLSLSSSPTAGKEEFPFLDNFQLTHKISHNGESWSAKYLCCYFSWNVWSGQCWQGQCLGGCVPSWSLHVSAEGNWDKGEICSTLF